MQTFAAVHTPNTTPHHTTPHHTTPHHTTPHHTTPHHRVYLKGKLPMKGDEEILNLVQKRTAGFVQEVCPQRHLNQ